MTTTASWNTTNGDWFDANNWSPAAVPNSSNDVVIGGSSPLTISYDGDDVVNSLSGDVAATLDIASGELGLLNGNGIIGPGIDLAVGALLTLKAGTLTVPRR